MKTPVWSLVMALASSVAIFNPGPVAAGGPALVKGSGAAIYFMAQGQRYAFPNEAVFKSWYTDFNQVSRLADSELEKLPFAGQVRFQPGSVLVKTPSDPKVYAISRYGVLHWITSEALAVVYYGQGWQERVVDVPSGLMQDYLVGFPLDKAGSYSQLDEMTATQTPADDIRPAGYQAPQTASASYPVEGGTATLNLTASVNEAVEGQTVILTAKMGQGPWATAKIEIYRDGSDVPLIICRNTDTCSFGYTVPAPPSKILFYAKAEDIAGNKTSGDTNQTVETMAQNAEVQLEATPQAVTTGGRTSVSSLYTGQADPDGHRIMAILPGETQPIQWLDCDKSRSCSGSVPLYRDTRFFSVVDLGEDTEISRPLLVTAQGGSIPKPTLSLTGQTGAIANLALTAPQGENIGATFLVEGTEPTDPAIAMCKDTCTLSVQMKGDTKFTAVTWVGGKFEKSQTLELTIE